MKPPEEDTSGEMIEINDGELVKVEPFHFDTINSNSELYAGKPSQKAKFIQNRDHLFCDSPDPSKNQKLEAPEYISINVDSKPLDEFDSFARFISTQLRELPPNHVVRAQCRILQCLADERVAYIEEKTAGKWDNN